MWKMTIQPRGPMVLIRRLPQSDERGKHGIQIPDSAKRALFKAEVLRAGEGVPCDGNAVGLRPIGLKQGDIVLVKDDPPSTDPRARMMNRNLIPITATGDDYLVNEAYIYAIDNALCNDDNDETPPIGDQDDAAASA